MERGEHSDNLPSQPWMLLRGHQLSPGLVDHVGNPVGCSNRDNSEQQAPFFTHGSADSRLRQSLHVPNTSLFQQFGLSAQQVHSSRSTTSNNLSQSDRSAWTHLLSLDPSLADSPINPPNSHHLPLSSFGHPFFEMGNLDRSSSDPSPVGQHLDLVNDNMPLSSMDTPFSQHSTAYNTSSTSNDNLQQRSIMSASHQTSSLNQLINLSRDAGNFSNMSTSVCHQSIGSLEPGGYSPVSPPCQDTGTSLTSQGGERTADQLKNDAQSSMAYKATSEKSFAYVSGKQAEQYRNYPAPYGMIAEMTAGNQNASCPSNSLPAPLDVPLDMTKVFTPKEKTPEVSTPKQESQLSNPVSSHALLEENGMNFSLKVNMSERPLKELITEQEKPSLEIMSQSHSSSDQHLRPIVKSTPKKSNFYGRDTSLFSHSDEPFSDSCLKPDNSRCVDSLSGNTDNNTVIDSSSSFVPLIDSRKPLLEENPQGSLCTFADVESVPTNNSSDCDSGASNFADSFIDASTRDTEPDNTVLASFSASVNKLTSVTPKQEAHQIPEMQECKVELSSVEYVDTQQEKSASAMMGIPCDVGKAGGDCQTVPSVFEGEIQNNIVQNSEQTDLKMEVDCIEPDEALNTAVIAAPIPKAGTKRRKRKGSGFQARQRRKPKKLKVIVSHLDTNGENPVPVTKPVRRRRKKALNTEEAGDDGNDAVPRRSSSRKSKANAMRLIELQADSSYGYVSQAVTEEPSSPPPIQGKKRGLRAKKKAEAKIELDKLSEKSSMSDENTDDGQDAEYAPDEEESLEDLSPNENGNGKGMRSKKVGGLKISIKLGAENLAHIVSGIRDCPSVKKRKTDVKKSGKEKSKNPVLVDGDAAVGNFVPISKETDERLSPEVKEKSLLDKYFHAAYSVKKPVNKDKVLKKPRRVNKRKLSTSEGSQPKTGTGKGKIKKVKKAFSEKSSVKFESADVSGSNVNESNNPSGVEEEAKFVCGYCPKRYHSKDDLMAHMEAHMAEMESKPAKDEKKHLPCPASKKSKSQPVIEKSENKSLSGVSKIEKNMSTSMPEHKCGECGQVFPSKSSLLDHVSTHTIDKPFECNLCHKCFKERDLLSAHRKTHQQEGLVRCSICSKGFIHEPDLIRHIQTHPKRSTPAVPLKRKISLAPQKVSKLVKASAPDQSKELSQSKRKSFASALSGQEDELTGKTLKTPTIALKRSEVPTALSSVDLGTKPSKASGSSQKASKQVEISDGKILSNASKTEGKTNKDNVVKKLDNKSNIEPEPGHCTCKECPECVTRFLQSFY